MYLKNEELNEFFMALCNKYEKVHVLMDVYTVFGAKASKYIEVGTPIFYPRGDESRRADLKEQRDTDYTKLKFADV